MKLLSFLILLMMVPMQTIAQGTPAMDKRGIEKEVMQVLDEFMSAFNNQDLTAWEKTLHFPHYRLASGTMNVTNEPGQTSEADMKRYFERIKWHHSTWDRRNIIHFSENKVHVDTQFTRYRQDGSIIGSYESLYILTEEQGKWGVKLRSSFAE